MHPLAPASVCVFYAEGNVLYRVQERRKCKTLCTNLHFILLKVLKLKDLRKTKNRIKIIVVLANRKARFFCFRCVNFNNKGEAIKSFGGVLILLAYSICKIDDIEGYTEKFEDRAKYKKMDDGVNSNVKYAVRVYFRFLEQRNQSI